MEKIRRNYSFDFLKIVASIGIVFFHYQYLTGARFDNFINFCGDWFNWGMLVELFFIISGYFMFRNISVIAEGRVTLFNWWKKRAVRLLPMAAITVFFFEGILILNKLVFHTNLWGIEVSVWGTLVTALGLQEGWILISPAINMSLWYLSVLMFCYIFFYMLTVLAAKIKCSPLYFYIIMILIGVAGGAFGFNLPFLNWQICRGYYAFFFGILLAAYVNKYGVRLKEIIASFLIIACFVTAFILYPTHIAKNINYTLTFLDYPAIVLLCETKVAKKIFCHKIWGVLSGISFEVYLWHVPLLLLLYFIMNFFGFGLNFSIIWIMLLFLLAVWIISTLIYFLVERPLMKVLTKEKKKKAEDTNEVSST